MANWKTLIEEEMQVQGETFENVESNTLSTQDMNKEFRDSYGGAEGMAFTLWTANRVYFPVTYDGAEWVASVSRNPDGRPTPHVGGQ